MWFCWTTLQCQPLVSPVTFQAFREGVCKQFWEQTARYWFLGNNLTYTQRGLTFGQLVQAVVRLVQWTYREPLSLVAARIFCLQARGKEGLGFQCTSHMFCLQQLIPPVVKLGLSPRSELAIKVSNFYYSWKGNGAAIFFVLVFNLCEPNPAIFCIDNNVMIETEAFLWEGRIELLCFQIGKLFRS